MKKKSPPYALIMAAVLAMVAIYAFVQYKKTAEQKASDAAAAARADMQKQIDDAKSKQVTVQETPTNLRYVLYATQPIEPGVRISGTFFEKKLTPKDILPDAYSDQGDIIGWYAVRKIEKGDPLTPRNVGKSLPYMSQRISPGMRAISLPVFNAENNDTGGFVVDGDKVDLLYTRLTLDMVFRVDTQIVMQNVSVLYVPGPSIKTDKTDGINPVPPPNDAIAVTFEVTPEQAQALIYLAGVKNGHFSMILRARKDLSEIKIKKFTGSDYFGNLKKVQKMTDLSADRVKTLADEIDAQEKSANAQATTNETATPTPPVP